MPDQKPGVTGASASLNRYWTKGEGLARWATSAHPWTTLRNLLLRYGVPKNQADGLASSYFHTVFGIWPGERKGTNPVGPG